MKKCIICSIPATFSIKDSSDYYCEECAEENFDSLECLTRIEASNVEPPKSPPVSLDAEPIDSQ